MVFFDNLKRSTSELKSIRCLCVTAVLIALDLALKTVTIYLPFTKITVAFLAVSAIGMLYGPVVGCLACAITDVLGLLVSQQISAFNPLFTLVEMTGGFIYGMFLYNFNVIKPDFSGGKAFLKWITSNRGYLIRIVLAKLTVVIVCNIFMNTIFQVVAGFIAPDAFFAKLYTRMITSGIKLPFDILLMLLTLYPVKAAYTAVFKKEKAA